MVQVGTKLKNTQVNTIYVVTSITDKRINLDQPGSVYSSSTGRQSSKCWIGHKSFQKDFKLGNWIIVE